MSLSRWWILGHIVSCMDKENSKNRKTLQRNRKKCSEKSDKMKIM